jgi:FtsZ-interacting cell division protein ZipA
MSELQIVLIVIGVLIIVAVLLVNWWQERRFHQQMANSFSPLDSDALLDDPQFNDAAAMDDSALAADVDANLADAEPHYQHAATTSSAVQATQTNAADTYSPESYATETYRSESYNTETYNTETYSTDNYGVDIASDDERMLADRYAAPEENSVAPAMQQWPETDSALDLSPVSAAESKPLQRDDIKAIFEEAFSNLNKTTVASAASRFVINNIADNAIADDDGALKANPARQALQQAPSLPAMLDAQIDLTALVYLATETAASSLSNALLSLVEGHDKPMFVHLLDSNQQWHLPSQINPDLAVIKVACSLQMADRSGAVSRPALHRFQLAVETFGAGLNASVEWLNIADALTTANELDAFCIDVDKSIGFHLLHGENGPFTGTKLRGLAEAQGLTLTTDGTFKYHNESASSKTLAPPDFVMFNRDDHMFSPEMLRASVVKSVSFQLDIPHVKQCTEVFSHMVQVARQMEIGLNATLVDDNNKVLNELQVDKIRQQLKSIQSAMQLRGIVAGSDSALRLFS